MTLELSHLTDTETDETPQRRSPRPAHLLDELALTVSPWPKTNQPVPCLRTNTVHEHTFAHMSRLRAIAAPTR